MKKIFLVLIVFFSLDYFAQISLEDGQNWAKSNGVTLNPDVSSYIGKDGFAAPVVITRDAGLMLVGESFEGKSKGAKVVFLNENKEVIWSHFFGSKNDNTEAQSVIEDRTGYFYIFMEAHNKLDATDTRERVVKVNARGEVQWDYALEEKEEHYHRHCAYVKLDEDGKRLALFGTVQPDKVAIENNEHYSWQAKLDGNGKLDSEIGDLLKD
ncbi:MAG: hypothetical protein P8L20_08940 [Flavobacteriales bacterium]|nr:hypothetical protein [Flavobacteriales bacterium]